MPAPLFAVCMAAAASAFQFPPSVLPAIQHVEGGAIGTVAHNKNGTDDLGLMQVNTSWVPTIAAATGLTSAEVAKRLRDDGCFSIAMAATILSNYQTEANGDIWRAVGFYHSHTPAYGLGYQAQVLTASINDLIGTVHGSP